LYARFTLYYVLGDLTVTFGALTAKGGPRPLQKILAFPLLPEEAKADLNSMGTLLKEVTDEAGRFLLSNRGAEEAGFR
jgi:hypothetical protein